MSLDTDTKKHREFRSAINRVKLTHNPSSMLVLALVGVALVSISTMGLSVDSAYALHNQLDFSDHPTLNYDVPIVFNLYDHTITFSMDREVTGLLLDHVSIFSQDFEKEVILTGSTVHTTDNLNFTLTIPEKHMRTILEWDKPIGKFYLRAGAFADLHEVGVDNKNVMLTMTIKHTSSPTSLKAAVFAPSSPTGLTATPGDGRVNLSWSAPNNGGAAIIDYTIEYRSGSTWNTFADGSSTATSATVTGLTNGVSYEFRVSAVNSKGTGAASTIVSTTPSIVPGAPIGLTATPGDGRVNLSWSAPNNGGAAIIDYTIEYRSGSTWNTFADGSSTATSATVTGLTNGVSYEFRVSAVNSKGTGAASTIVSTTPSIVPGAPIGLTATSGDGRVNLSWSAPNNGGAAIIDYTIEYRSGSTWNTFADGSSTTTSATVTGLANGISYEFRVSAVNSKGTGTASDTVSSTPIAPVLIALAVFAPSSPTGLAATPGDGRVNLSWSAPNNGGAAIIDYTIEYRSGSTWNTFADGSSTTTSATVTGLANGISYEFRVSAVNSKGTGTASDTVSSTPIAPVLIALAVFAPSSPTGLAATPGDGRVNLSWSAPNNGGAAIIDYTIEYRSGSTWNTFADGSSTTTSATVTGLANGISYEFRVSAVNSKGTGTASDTVLAMPLTVPSSPTGLAATPGDGRVNLSWSAPNNGGAAIIDYTIEYSSGSTWNTFADGSSTTTSATVTGLANGISYEFRVSAVNSKGTGTASDTVLAMPLTVPSSPTGLAATPGDGRVNLSWSAPNNGGAAIIDYTIEYSSGSMWNTFADGSSTTTSATVTGLANGISYEFRVSAVNSKGTGTASDTVLAMPLTVPSSPTELTASPGNGQVHLSWRASPDTISTATDYIIEYDSDGTLNTFTSDIDSTSLTVTGLENNMPYKFAIHASNPSGNSPPVTVTTIPSENMPSETMDSITVGVIVSTSGEIQTVGNIINDTIHHAVDEFNSYLRLQDKDWQLGIRVYNDGSTGSGSTAGIMDLNNGGIKAVIGPASSESLSATSQYMEDNGMVSISYGSTAPTLAKKDNIFRLAVNDANLAKVFADLLSNDQIQHVIPVYRDDEWGRALYDSISESLDDTITLQQGVRYDPKSLDYETIIQELEQQLKYDSSAVILLSFGEIIHIVDEATSHDSLYDTKWYSSDLDMDKLLEDDARKNS